jgi:hypothetical protein
MLKNVSKMLTNCKQLIQNTLNVLKSYQISSLKDDIIKWNRYKF